MVIGSWAVSDETPGFASPPHDEFAFIDTLGIDNRAATLEGKARSWSFRKGSKTKTAAQQPDLSAHIGPAANTVVRRVPPAGDDQPERPHGPGVPARPLSRAQTQTRPVRTLAWKNPGVAGGNCSTSLAARGVWRIRIE